jgi:hypothetical protein
MLGVDHPLALSERWKPVRERVGIGQIDVLAEELKPAVTMGVLALFEESAPKEARQHPDRSIEVSLQAVDRRTAAYSHISWPADGSTFEPHQWT